MQSDGEADIAPDVNFQMHVERGRPRIGNDVAAKPGDGVAGGIVDVEIQAIPEGPLGVGAIAVRWLIVRSYVCPLRPCADEGNLSLHAEGHAGPLPAKTAQDAGQARGAGFVDPRRHMQGGHDAPPRQPEPHRTQHAAQRLHLALAVRPRESPDTQSAGSSKYSGNRARACST